MHCDFIFFSAFYTVLKVCTYVRVPHTLCILVFLSFNSAVALDLLMHDCVFVHTVVQGLTSFCTHALAVHSKFYRNPGHPSKVAQTGKLCIFVVI